MSFFAETVATRTAPNTRQSVTEGAYVGHVYNSGSITAVLISDADYPIRPAYTLLNKIVAETDLQTETYPNLDSYLSRYADPSQADGILKVQAELDETKIILHKTIESVLQRGERLDSLVDKSETLSSSSRMFYKQAKKTNSCCVIV